MEIIMSEKVSIGILAVQGAFAEHQVMLDGLGADTFLIRQKKDLEEAVQNGRLQGIVLPGGESTVQGKLLRELDLFDGIKSRIESGMPVYGTCAGLILLAKSISNDSAQHLQTMSIVANRNAYGRQLGSFHTEAQFEGIGEIPMTFIRAPYIDKAYDDVQVLSEVDGKIVAARQKNQLVTAFHPELDGDTRVHEYFLNM